MEINLSCVCMSLKQTKSMHILISKVCNHRTTVALENHAKYNRNMTCILEHKLQSQLHLVISIWQLYHKLYHKTTRPFIRNNYVPDVIYTQPHSFIYAYIHAVCHSFRFFIWLINILPIPGSHVPGHWFTYWGYPAKRAYLPCVSMEGRALLARHPLHDSSMRTILLQNSLNTPTTCL